MTKRRVKLFRYGRHQAVRIPREFELSGENAIMRKEGERLIIESARAKSLLAVLATLETLDEDFRRFVIIHQSRSICKDVPIGRRDLGATRASAQVYLATFG